MASEVDICNIALSNLGEKPISARNDANQRARACDNRFDDVRDLVLRSHIWNCALKRAQLTSSATAPTWGYDYAFPKPAEMLRLITVAENTSGDNSYSFKIEGENIVTNSPTLYILYIERVTDTAKYDSLLVQAIALRLATEIAQDLTGKTELKNSLMHKYREVLSESRSADAAEGTPQKIESDLWLQSRYTNIDSWRPFSASVVQEDAY